MNLLLIYSEHHLERVRSFVFEICLTFSNENQLRPNSESDTCSSIANAVSVERSYVNILPIVSLCGKITSLITNAKTTTNTVNINRMPKRAYRDFQRLENKSNLTFLFSFYMNKSSP